MVSGWLCGLNANPAHAQSRHEAMRPNAPTPVSPEKNNKKIILPRNHQISVRFWCYRSEKTRNLMGNSISIGIWAQTF